MEKKKVLSIIILIIFVVLGVIFLKGRTHELYKILKIDFKYVIILSALIALQSFFRGHKLKLIMNIYDIKLKFKEWWGMEIMTEVGNNVLPFKGGLPARAVYFKKKHNLSYHSFVSGTGLSYLIDFLGFGLIGSIASLFLSVESSIKYSILTFFGLIFLATSFVLFLLPLPIRINIKLLKHVVDSINEIKIARANGLFILNLFLNFLIRCGMTISRLYFGFLAFGLALPFYTCVVMGVFLGVSKLVSITPMGLGFRESVVAVSSKLFSVGAMVGVLATALDRVLTVILTFLFAPVFSYWLAKDFKVYKKDEPEISNDKNIKKVEKK